MRLVTLLVEARESVEPLGVETRHGVGVAVGALPAVSATVAQSIVGTIYAAPYDHFAVGPDCRVTRSR